MSELPSMSSAQMSSTSAQLSQFNAQAFAGNNHAAADARNYNFNAAMLVGQQAKPLAPIATPKKETPMPGTPRRVVQVFIADTHESVPLTKSLIYRSDPKLTDLNDQELFFEIDIKTLLEQHNAERVKIVDKAVKERTEYLEPARIRDLRMVVVNVAAF